MSYTSTGRKHSEAWAAVRAARKARRAADPAVIVKARKHAAKATKAREDEPA